MEENNKITYNSFIFVLAQFLFSSIRDHNN